MPTILDNLGIAQCSVTYGKEASFAGKTATVSIRITPMAVGVGQLRLTWAATGDIFSAFDDSTKGDPGMPGVIVLPQTGQSGFRHGTTVFKDWYYQAYVISTLDDGQTLTRSYRFQIPAGTTTLDLDLLDEDGPVALPAVAPILAEPAGLSPETRTSLAATYLAKWKPNTVYAAGQVVVNPTGQNVSAKADFTSGATYDASNWTSTTSGFSLVDLGNGLASITSTGTASITDLGNGLASITSTGTASITDLGNGLAALAA